ncbi:hypothetical protein [Microcella alkaliphila]|nr:hypothetical protein [Microcella alkaliphila]
MSTSPQTRQPKGLPVGGQFAAADRAESGVTLDSADGRAAGDLTDREILDQAIMLARIAGSRAGLNEQDIEDIAKETVFWVLRTKKAKGGIVTGGLLRVASRALVSRMVDSHIRHGDSRALTIRKRVAADREQELGRHLGADELDEMAANIRPNWQNHRHKPRIGFQHQVRFASTEAMGAVFSDGHAAKSNDPDACGVRALADSVEDGLVPAAQAGLHVWNILAADSGAHLSVPGIIGTAADARRIKRAVPNSVDIATACLDGTATPEQQTALFAPFGGGLTPRQRAHMAAR